MEDSPDTGPQGQPAGRAEAAEAWTAVPDKPLGENALLNALQRPRIMLVLLALWSLTAFLTQVFVNSGLFLEQHFRDGERKRDLELDGVFGGLALGWEPIALAALYLYCARDPVRYQRIFWLALIHQGALIAAGVYHWLAIGTFTFESVFIPLAVSGGLTTLVFLHLFRPRSEEERISAAVGERA
ncbi:MAG: hypothetical protein Q7T33_14690 [Dehalococcoidia bacterium]|nr:hypothetical protein [Dehalococcoidia bacterium]